MNYVVDKVKEEQKEDVSILTHPHGGGARRGRGRGQHLLWSPCILFFCILLREIEHPSLLLMFIYNVEEDT